MFYSKKAIVVFELLQYDYPQVKCQREPQQLTGTKKRTTLYYNTTHCHKKSLDWLHKTPVRIVHVLEYTCTQY